MPDGRSEQPPDDTYLYEPARHAQEAGIRAAKQGDFVAAFTQFGAAEAMLLHATPNDTTALAQADLQRDIGFSWIRRALQSTGQPDFEDSTHVGLDRLVSASSGAERVARRYPLDRWDQTTNRAITRRRAEIHANHGATIACIARAMTARAAWLQIHDFRDPEISFSTASPLYRQAYDELVDGNNMYYRAKTAMTAARNERLRGNAIGMAVWFLFASRDVLLCRIVNRANYEAARDTYIGRIADLRSSDTIGTAIRHP